jgi:hypothetical protein
LTSSSSNNPSSAGISTTASSSWFPIEAIIGAALLGVILMILAQKHRSQKPKAQVGIPRIPPSTIGRNSQRETFCDGARLSPRVSGDASSKI